MPLFWKKTLKNASSLLGNSTSSSPESSRPASPSTADLQLRHSKLQSSLQNGSPAASSLATTAAEEASLQSAQQAWIKRTGVCLDDPQWTSGRSYLATRESRLSQSIPDILHDQSALTHFIQYLESRDALHLIKFWLDAESFRASASQRLNSCEREQERVRRKQELHAPLIQRTDLHLPVRFPTSDESSPDTSPASASLPSSSSDSEPSNPPPPKPESLVDKLRSGVTEDATLIFKKYIAKDATSPIGVSSELRDEIMRRICREDGCVDPACFTPAQDHVCVTLDKEYHHDYLESVYHCKHQIEVLTSGRITLEDILFNEAAFFYFMEFMEQEDCRNLLEFWLAVDNFRSQMSNGAVTQGQAQDDAIVLYDRYFSLQASCPVGFGDSVRLAVERNICCEDGPAVNCFDEPLSRILAVLDKVFLSQFIGSQLYVKFLSDLVSTVQTSHLNIGRRKRSGSDSSSEHSVSSSSTLNTLLVMDSSQPGMTAAQKKLSKKVSGQDMRIDMGQFHPDTLWQRPLAGKLQLGRVNHLGQFVTDLEPEPERKRANESRLTKAMRKLVLKDEDKNKEEMAIQVAQMIVSEVTSITMNQDLEFMT